MYKYFKKDKYDIMYYYFDSISEFLDYICNTNISKTFSHTKLNSKSYDKDWSGTDTFDEAVSLAKYGTSSEFEHFLTLKKQLDKYIKLNIDKSKQHNWYIGYAPDVKAYLEGNPLSMFNKVNSPKKQIDIYFNTVYHCFTSNEQIYNRGVITLNIIELLEQLNYIVNLNIFSMIYSNNQIHYAVFNLKNAGAKINIKKLYFPLCQNAWLRRLVFRLIEVTPDIDPSWLEGYGFPASDALIRKIIDLKENDLIIPQPSEIGITGVDLIRDANTFFNFINNENQIDIKPFTKIKKR